MLHEQNRKELKKLCGGDVPPHIQGFFQEVTEYFETLRGRQFRASEMAVLYAQAVRLDPVQEAKTLAAKDAAKDAEALAKKVDAAGGTPPVELPFKVKQEVLVDVDGQRYKAKFVGLVEGSPDKLLVRYQEGAAPVEVPRGRVKARK